MATNPSDVMFSDAVKATQSRLGSRAMFEKREVPGGWNHTVTPDLASFLALITTCYIATTSTAGQPYIQHRGGPPGFLRPLDDATIGFADFAGNKQYITTGNLTENDRVCLFLMDYEAKRRIKIWGTARVVENDPNLIARLMPESYRARPERAVLITVAAWDINCSQHIPQMFHAGDVANTIKTFQARVRELDAENAALKARIAELEARA
jgi:uncharacterized protein